MSRFKAFAFASCVGLFAAAFAPTVLNADQWDKKTVMTVNEAIQVPNKVLQPGKYVIRLLDSPSNRHIVQIFDENEQNLVTTILAIPNYRLQPAGDTRFGFWETPAGQPKALRSWFYPGDNFGQEFAYPKSEAMRIAAVAGGPVPTTYAASESDLTTARVSSTDRTGTEQELNRETYTPAETQTQATTQTTTQAQVEPRTELPVAQPQPREQVEERTTEMAQTRTPSVNTADAADNEADRAGTPQELPRTASNYPAIALLGLLSFAAFGVVTVLAKRPV